MWTMQRSVVWLKNGLMIGNSAILTCGGSGKHAISFNGRSKSLLTALTFTIGWLILEGTQRSSIWHQHICILECDNEVVSRTMGAQKCKVILKQNKMCELC